MTPYAAGGRFIVMGVPARLDKDARRTIKQLQPGGFILFGRNIGLPEKPGAPAALRAFVDELRSLVEHEPIVCIDQEGGRVSRLRGLLGGAEPPSARSLAAKKNAKLIQEHGRLTGRLLRLFGLNLDLCPVLDIEYAAEADNSLANRCWGKTPAEVARNAGSFNAALRAAGVLSCGKHFPGYSRAALDPHEELPVIRASRKDLEKDWLPYRTLLGELDFVMPGHGLYPALDPSGLPASLSEKILSLLREELGFQGWIISDDLDMGAVTRHVGLDESVQRAVSAGTDFVLLCHDLARVRQAASAIASLPGAVLRKRRQSVERLAGRLWSPAPFSRGAFNEINAAIQKLRDAALGKKAPKFSGGASKMGAVEARVSAVNTVGDRKAGAPEEYRVACNRVVRSSKA
jgi:beta-N-acetylhexosaminidase